MAELADAAGMVWLEGESPLITIRRGQSALNHRTGSNPVLTIIKKTHMREIIEILKTLPNVITSVSGTIESITISYDTNGEAKVEIKFYNKS